MVQELIWGLKIRTYLNVIWPFPILLDAYTELYAPDINQVN